MHTSSCFNKKNTSSSSFFLYLKGFKELYSEKKDSLVFWHNKYYLTHFSIEQGKLGLANITEHGWLLIIGRLDRTWMFWPAKSSITHWGPAIGRCWATTSHKLKIFLKNYWDDWDSWAISLVGDPACSVICFDFFNKMKIFEIMKGDKGR